MSKRGEFLKKCLEMNLTGDQILKMTQQMRGKTDEEKEAIAEHFLERLTNDDGMIEYLKSENIRNGGQ